MSYFNNLLQFIATVTERFSAPQRGVDSSEGVLASDVRDALIDTAKYAEDVKDYATGFFNSLPNLPLQIFENTVAGLAATTDKKYFYVPVSGANNLLTLYFNNAGTAVEVGKSPSQKLLETAQKTNVFQGAVDTVVPLTDFLLDIQLNGLTAGASDEIHIDNVRRGKVYTSPSFVRHLFRVAKNGVSIASWYMDAYVEPVADASGRRIATLNLIAEGGSGVTGVAIVDWAVLTTNTEHVYTDSTARKKSLLSPKKYMPSLLARSLDIDGKVLGSMVKVGTTSDLVTELNRIDKSNIFRGAETSALISSFLLSIQLDGLTFNSSDEIHIDNVRRGKVYTSPSFVRHLFRVAKNGVSIASWYMDAYVEPVADASGRRIATLNLIAEGGSGVTGVAIVDWSVLTLNTEYIFTSTPDRLKTLLSPKIINPSAPLIAINERVEAGLKADLFSGIPDSNLNSFLVSLSLKGVVVNSTDVVHIFWVWRQTPNPTLIANSFSIGINGVRVASWTQNSYVEPAVDAKGNIYATLTLAEIGGSGITGTAVVNWAFATVGQKDYSSADNRKKAMLKPKVWIQSLDTLVINQRIDALEKNDFFLGTPDSYLLNFLVALDIDGVVVNATDVVHIFWVWRQTPNPTLIANSFSIGINGVRVASWTQNSYVEPTADAKGNIYATLTLAEIGGSGVTGKAVVNWAFAPNGKTEYSTTDNQKKALLKSKVYSPSVSELKLSLPDTTVPNRIYTVLNDIDSRNIVVSGEVLIRQDLVRQYALSLYLDRFLKSFPINTDVRFSETGSDKFPLISRRKGDFDVFTDHATPSETVSKNVTINGGTNYNNRTVAVSHISTRESTGADALVKCLTIGDSTVYGIVMDVGVHDGYAHKAWGVIHEQFQKCRIDYLLEQGYTPTQIQSNSISPTHDKHRHICIGTRMDTAGRDDYAISYRGVNQSFSLKAEGRGGWMYNAYLNKPRRVGAEQGSWDMLGLGNGSGTDYVASEASKYAVDRAAWTPTACIDTPAMRAYFSANFGYTGTTLADYIARMQLIELTPENPFYDADTNRIIVDGNGNNWTVRFSLAKYLSRYRTMDDSGVRLVAGNPAIGANVGANLATLDVCLPSHIIMQSCQNDLNHGHFGVMTKVFADAVKAEYTANSWGTVNVGISIIDGAGTYFPHLYPTVGAWATMDEGLRAVHNDNLQRAITANPNEDSNRVFVLANTFIIPTAKSIVSRGSNLPEYDLTGNEDDMVFVPSRTSVGIKAHINAVGNRPIGLHHYAWIRYTLGLL